ncbi:MAG: thioredoxin-disulfide reductase [Candidatus Omnitrophica bacterium]|nr:thioredoxin-disulfide reductase [Candidatus Omnitrophota bacterium]
MRKIYDIVIIGAGPAGLTAGIYASRARLKTLLLEKAMCGGQALIADTIENFPGFPDGIKGPDLGNWILKQAEHFGVEKKLAEAKRIIPKKEEKGPFAVVLDEGEDIHALSLIIATGARWNALGIPGEKELTGRGVSYCATCDGPLFKGKDLVVIGGGDTALEDALFLTKFANKITIIHRRDRLRATEILQERAFANKRIEFCYNSIATGIVGRTKVEGIKIKDVNTGKEKIIKSEGVFVFIGILPNSEILKGLVKMDEKGYIISDEDMKTSADGIFACGDVRKKLLRQIVTAAGEGATAAFSAQAYVERLKGQEYK